MEAELQILTDKFGAESAEKIQKFAFKHAGAETDRATYQAMEAFVQPEHYAFQGRRSDPFQLH